MRVSKGTWCSGLFSSKRASAGGLFVGQPVNMQVVVKNDGFYIFSNGKQIHVYHSSTNILHDDLII